jgi:hypothetical protein
MKGHSHRRRLEWNAAQEKRWKKRVAEERKRRSDSLVIWIPLFLIAGYMAVDSIYRLRSGDIAMDYNYVFQPVGPVMRLAVAVFLLCVGAFCVWRGRKSRYGESR